MNSSWSNALVAIGVLLIVIGLVAKTGALSWFGRLPGDIRIERESTRLYVPWVSMLVVSGVLSLVLNLLGRWFRDR